MKIKNNPLKVAFIDTGLSANLPWWNRNTIDGVGVKLNFSANSCCNFTSSFVDYHGHGTLVGTLLLAFCPSVSLVPVRISQVQEGRYTNFVPEKALAIGIDWCVENDIRLVNISYSIEEIACNGALATACRKANNRKTILVAAYRNNSRKPVYPAALSSVIGVSTRKDIDHAQVAIISEKNHDVAAFGGPYQIVSPDNTHKVISGTSFATAQVTGMIARVLTVKPTLTLEQVFSYLTRYATR